MGKLQKIYCHFRWANVISGVTFGSQLNSSAWHRMETSHNLTNPRWHWWCCLDNRGGVGGDRGGTGGHGCCVLLQAAAVSLPSKLLGLVCSTVQLSDLYTSQLPDLYTSQLPNLYTSQLPDVYTSQLPDLYTSQQQMLSACVADVNGHHMFHSLSVVEFSGPSRLLISTLRC